MQQVVAYLLFGFGFLGVPLFFIISGFCIHLPFATSSRSLEAAPFAKRRFFRLYPAYFVTCLVAFALAVVSHGLGQDISTFSNLAGHLVFWHYDFPPVPGGAELTIVLWSIVIEVHFYILYALFFRALTQFGLGRATVVSLAIGIAYRVAWHHFEMGGGQGDMSHTLVFFEPHRFALARFGEWLLGAWIAERYVRGDFKLSQPSLWLGWTGVLLGIGFVAVSMLTVALLSGTQYNAEIPVTLGFGWVLAALISLEQTERISIAGRFRTAAVWLGDRSYSLYLIHYLVIAVAGEIYVRLMGIADKDALAGTLPWFGVTGAAVILALIVADIMYRMVERPSHGLARRISSRQASASSAKQPAVCSPNPKGRPASPR